MKADNELRQDISAELNLVPSVRDEDVAIAVSDGVVTLGGTVDSYAQRYAAEHAVERIKGVRAIVNDLNVTLPTATERSDTDVAHAAVNALRWDIEVPDDRLRVRVADGWVTLEGTVEWPYQRSSAERAVRYLTGVKGISNLIAVGPGPTPSDVQKRIDDMLKRQAQIDASQITVEASDHTITLRGTVRSLAEKKDAERAAWSCQGVTNVENQLKVELYAGMLS